MVQKQQFQQIKTLKLRNISYDLYTEVGVGSGDFGTKAEESFGQGQSAMVYKWGHYNNTLLDKYPDINYGVFQKSQHSQNRPLRI